MRITKRDLLAFAESLPDTASVAIHTSQFGEDVVLWHYLKDTRDGFYVDIGAHDPYRFSNTFLLHRFRDWRGINVDMDSRAIEKFRTERPHDTNLRAALSDRVEEIEFTEFKDGAVNTADPDLRARQATIYQASQIYSVTTTTLSEILDAHLPPNADFKLLSIDVEGLDLRVLKGNNWDRYSPDYIAIETHGLRLEHLVANPCHAFLKEHGYQIISHTVVTSIYRRLSGGDPPQQRKSVAESAPDAATQKNAEPSLGWQDDLRRAEQLTHAGEDWKALTILDAAQRKYAKHGGAKWVAYHKALLVLKLKGLEAARQIAMDALASPIPPPAKSFLRAKILHRMSEAGDREGLEKLLPDQLLDCHNRKNHEQALAIAERHGMLPLTATIERARAPSHLAFPERTITYSVPPKARYPSAIKKALGGYAQSCHSPEVALHSIVNCTAIFIGGYSFFFDASGNFINDCSDNLSSPLVKSVNDLLNGQTPTIPNVSAYIRDRFLTSNYCHWLLDWIPRLAICERGGNFDNIVLEKLGPDFMKDSLAHVGHSDKNIIELAGSKVWRFEKLLLPDNSTTTFRHPMQLCHPDLIEWWRSKTPVRRPLRKLYIPRVNKRVVLNEEELINLLDGFVVFDAGRHSFAEQLEVFSEAEVIIGAHGAGLTNMLFAPKGCQVLELFPHQGGTAAFACLANALGHDYDLVIADGPSLPEGEVEPNHLSFIVPLDPVARFLEGKPLRHTVLASQATLR